MWGSGYCGSLGTGSERDEAEPQWVQALDGMRIVQVSFMIDILCVHSLL